jgi:hypothetical protein
VQTRRSGRVVQSEFPFCEKDSDYVYRGSRYHLYTFNHSMAASTSRWAHLPLYFDYRCRVVICRDCRYALPVAHAQVTSHLRDRHHIPAEFRKGLSQWIEDQRFREPRCVAPCEDGSDVHPFLREYDGFRCRYCPYRTINIDSMCRHLSHEHLPARGPLAPRSFDEHYKQVVLQSWACGATCKYWEAIRHPSPPMNPGPVRGNRAHAEFDAIQARERARLSGQRMGSGDLHSDPPTLETTTPWMVRTRWDETYQGLPKRFLRDLMTLPSKHSMAQGLILSSGPHDLTVAASAQDEQRLMTLINSVDIMLDRCEETMRLTGRPLLCWLRTCQPSPCYPKPFQPLGRNASRVRYRRYWKQFLTFTFRVGRLTTEQRKYLRLPLASDASHLLTEVWDHPILPCNHCQPSSPASSPPSDGLGGGFGDDPVHFPDHTPNAKDRDRYYSFRPERFHIDTDDNEISSDVTADLNDDSGNEQSSGSEDPREADVDSDSESFGDGDGDSDREWRRAR